MTEYINIYTIECADFCASCQKRTLLFFRRMREIRVTIDLEREIVIIPDNFFKKIAEENEKLQKYGAEPVKALDRIKHSYETAMADTDNRLLTQTNAKTSRSKKTMTPEEAKRILEEEAAKSAATK